MTFTYRPVTALVTHLEILSATRQGRRQAAAWGSSTPELTGYGTAAQIATVCRASNPDGQDRIVGALLAIADDDELAQLTAVTGLAGHLDRIASAWGRSGVPAWEAPELAGFDGT